MARDLNTFRFLTGLLTPGGVLLLATWAMLQQEVVRAAAAPYAVYYCFGALTAAVLLSWYYDYSRLLCTALAVGATAWGLGRMPAGDDVPRLAAVFLLPANFILFAALKERGVLTISGFLKIGLVAAQFLGVAWLRQNKVAGVDAFLRWDQHPAGWTWMPRTEQLAFAAALVVIVVLLFLRRTKVEQGLLWCLIAVFVGLDQVIKPEALLFYSGTAGLILLFAVLEQGYDIAFRDELTGLPGRRAFNQYQEQLGSDYAIAMCDVDHFKKFNDTYGHDAGDQVLKMVALQLSHVRGGGKAFRYGGEEFLIVFRGKSAKEAEPNVESLRKGIAEAEFVLRGPDRPSRKTKRKPASAGRTIATPITISIGVAERSKRHSSPELVVEAADAAMYRAKEAGRNCVRIAESNARKD